MFFCPLQVNAETGSAEVSLTMSNVSSDTYKTYHIIATNSIGTSEFSIVVTEGKL